MIKNERQYRITKKQLARFESAVSGQSAAGDDDGLGSLCRDAVSAQVSDLASQIAEYEALRSGSATAGDFAGIDTLPTLLIRKRIALGMTQQDLAQRLGMKEQQIQRYEADDWATASLKRLTEVADAVGLTVDLGSATAGPLIDERKMVRALQGKGLDTAFLKRRLRPPSEGVGVVVDFAARVGRVYGWRPSDVLAGELGGFESSALAASFKLQDGREQARTDAYTVYSHYLALLSTDCASQHPIGTVPIDPLALRAEVIGSTGTVEFAKLLDFTWRAGIIVLPLSDPGVFDAALWRVRGRNVVVLKQSNRSTSRWKYDLLHEIGHAIESPEELDLAVVEDIGSTGTSASEAAANRFAGDVLLDGMAEEIAEEVVSRAKGKVQLLKAAVPLVAEDYDIDQADLANYLARRLSSQKIDWWGAATNLQHQDDDPFEVCRTRFLSECDLHALSHLDADLLLQALEDAK